MAYSSEEKAKAYRRRYRAANKERIAARLKQWYHDNKEWMKEYRKANRNRQKGYELRIDYGISLEQYNEMLSACGGKCLICQNVAKLCIDHCHSSSKVRGLLCRMCNKGLGCFRDDPNRLAAAIKYLTKELNG